ncbi:MAG: glycosyltransferase family 87 protein, partial [Vicinamibacterales bacterium]
MTSSRLRLLLTVLVVLAAAEFVVRGPLRFARHGTTRSTDFTGPYLGARALVRGLNPYSSDVFWTMAEEVGWTDGRNDRDDDFESRSPYPLPTFVLMAPLAPFGWQPARLIGTVVMAALVVASLLALSTLEGLRNAGPSRLAFIAFGLALAPVHSGLGAGNLAAAAVPFSLLGVWAMGLDRHTAAGVCLGLAACIKPPIAAPLLGYALFRGRWRVVMTAVGVVVTLVGVGAVQLLGRPWLSGYIANNSLLLADSGTAVVKWSEAQQQFINVHYLGYLLFEDPRVIN